MSTFPTLKTVLKALTKASDALSIPDLKNAIKSLVEAITLFEKSNKNNSTLQELITTLRRLENVVITPLSTTFDGSRTSPELEARIERLSRELSELAKRQKHRRSQVPSSAIFDTNKGIGELVDKFSWYTQTTDGESSRHQVSSMTSHSLSKEVKGLPYAIPATFDSISRKGLPLCLSGTREAVTNTIDIWLNSNSRRMLVLKGSAGTGKSTIARTIATLVVDQHRLAACFFFSKDDASCKSPNLFFPTLAFQLARYSEEFAAQISKVLEQSPAVINSPLPGQFENLIIKPLSSIQRAPTFLPLLIIVDGMDECEREGAKKILRLLVGRILALPSWLKILITTRPQAHLQSILGSLNAKENLTLDQAGGALVEGDTRRFLQHQLSRPNIRGALPGCEWQLQPENLDIIVKRTGRMFLVSAVIDRLVKDIVIRNPQSQLEAVLKSMKKNNKTKPLLPSAVLDYLYTHTLKVADLAAVALDNFHIVIGAIVVLEVPLPLQPLCHLLDMELENARAVLSHLTVIIDSGEDGGFLRVYHRSFIDFITTHNRCKDKSLLIKPATHHQQIAGRCFDVMARLLKRNICQIPPSDQYLENDIMPNLETKVKTHIPQELEYACCHWGAHLSKTPSGCQPIMEALERFAFKHLLFWLEALSLIGHLGEAAPALKVARKYVASSGGNAGLRKMINDALRFVTTYYAIIKISSLHVYYSALPLVPSRSVLSDTYAAEAAGSVQVLQGGGAYWSTPPLTLKGHSSYVYSVVFSPNGMQLVSAGGDKTIRLWDSITGNPIAVLNGHTEEAYHATYSPDGTLLVSTSRDLTVRLWNVTSIDLIATMEGHSKPVNSATFSPDGTLVASAADDRTVRLWDVTTRSHKATLEGHTAWVRIVEFSPDGTQLASASGDHTIKIWNVGTGASTITLKGHTLQARTVVFSPDGSQLATASDDQSIRMWDAVTGANVFTLNGHSAEVWDIRFSNDGTQLASGSADKTVRVWDVATRTPIAVIQGHTGVVRSVAFSHDGSRLASSSEDNTIRIRDTPEAHEDIVEAHSTEVDSVILSPDASRLVSASSSTVMLWDVVAGTPTATLGDNVDNKARGVFSPDGTLLVSSSIENAVTILDTVSGTRKATLEGHTDRVIDIMFSSDGTRLASVSLDNTIKLWDVTSGTIVATLECLFDRVLCATFSPDDVRVVAGSEDGRVQIWDTIAGTHITTLERHTGPVWNVLFSFCGTQLASASDDGSIVLWNGEDGDYVRSLEGHSNPALNVAFSLDGTQVASGSADGTIRVWKSSSGGHLAVLEGHPGRVWDVVFSLDGSQLASASDDLTVRIWDIASGVSLNVFDNYYCYPDLSGVFTGEGVHVVKRHGYPALVRLHRRDGHLGPIYQLPLLCWLPPAMLPTRTHSIRGVVAVGSSIGRTLCLRAFN